MQTRIAAMNKFVEILKTKREIIVNVLRVKGWAATGDRSVGKGRMPNLNRQCYSLDAH